MKTKICALCLTSLYLLGIAGCGGGAEDAPELAPATGTVYLDDKPLEGAIVTFVVEGKPLATATTDAEGKFTMTTRGEPGAPIGSAKVGIVKHAGGDAGGGNEELTPEDMIKMAEAGEIDKEVKSEVPDRYGNPETSGEQVTVDADGSKNVYEFRLSSK